MGTQLTKQPRSLAKLTPLIRRELKAGFQAGERHWKKVGRLLNEARTLFPATGPAKNGLTFHQWVEENFEHPWTGEKLSLRNVQRWMQATRRVENSSRRDRRELSLTAASGDKRSPSHEDYKPKLDWKQGVRDVQQKVNVKQLEKQWEDEDQRKREQAALARKIVDAGYRALSAVVHPDRQGGSREAMAKLTDARKWIEELIRRAL